MHWPDADRAGHSQGWMSREYETACRKLDFELHKLSSIACDNETLCVAVADHGGGGVKQRDHESEHPLDKTIPLLLWGAAVTRVQLNAASILDVAPTILHALGVGIPASFQGRVLHEAFTGHLATKAAAA